MNAANSAVVDVAASSALGVQRGHPMSDIERGVPTTRNDASRVGSGPARVRPGRRRIPQSSSASSRPLFLQIFRQKLDFSIRDLGESCEELLGARGQGPVCQQAPTERQDKPSYPPGSSSNSKQR